MIAPFRIMLTIVTALNKIPGLIILPIQSMNTSRSYIYQNNLALPPPPWIRTILTMTDQQPSISVFPLRKHTVNRRQMFPMGHHTHLFHHTCMVPILTDLLTHLASQWGLIIVPFIQCMMLHYKVSHQLIRCRLIYLLGTQPLIQCSVLIHISKDITHTVILIQWLLCHLLP